jgi:hypothetical protein
MTQTAQNEQSFEEAFDRIALASWNRPRTTAELRQFVRQHHDALTDVEVEL